LKIDLDEYRDRLQRRMGGAQHTIMSRIVQRAERTLPDASLSRG